MRSLLMIAMVALLAACGSSDNDQKGSAVVETVPQTRDNDGLRWPRRDGLKWPHLASVVVLG
jgi:ABC-type glycerol-3-phosphate transport system substrate-binding protein